MSSQCKALISVLYTSILSELFTANINLSITSVFKEIKIKNELSEVLAVRCLSHPFSPTKLALGDWGWLPIHSEGCGQLDTHVHTCGWPLQDPGCTLHMRSVLTGRTTVQAAISTGPCVWWLEDYNKFWPICVLKFSCLWVQREKMFLAFCLQICWDAQGIYEIPFCPTPGEDYSWLIHVSSSHSNSRRAGSWVLGMHRDHLISNVFSLKKL